nr:TM0106 family RecB-like putative nuclease [Candidatus Undinarchaeales archaeon ERR594346 U_76725]
MTKIDELFKKCTEGNGKFVKGGDLANYIKEPFIIYCNDFAPEDARDKPKRFQELLSEAGMKHEADSIEAQHPGMNPLKFTKEREGFKLVLDAFFTGKEAVANGPLIYLPENLIGRADLLEKRKGESVFGNYHYIVKEIKLAKNLKRDHVLQAAYYNLVLGKIQGFTPEEFYLVNRNNDIFSYKFSDYKSTLELAISDVLKIKTGEIIPSATYGSVKYNWTTYTNKIAKEADDVSLIPGISGAMKTKLNSSQFFTVSDIMEADISNLTDIEGIGDVKASQFKLCAESLKTGKPFIKNKDAIILPDTKSELYFDLEGTDEVTSGAEPFDYLMGILESENGSEKYISFLAETPDDEEKIFRDFLKYLDSKEDYILYHWNTYEVTALKKLFEKYQVDGTKILKR